MLGHDNNTINSPHIIFCEGMDEKSFLINYLNYMGERDDYYDERFDVKDFGGISELENRLAALKKMPNFDTVKSILIIRDAETDANTAKLNIKNALEYNGFTMPSRPGVIVEVGGIKISYLLFPYLDGEGKKPGTLEHLCLELASVEDKELILNDVNNLLEKTENEYKLRHPRIHKNQLHTFMSLFDKYAGSKAGEAGKYGLYDWEHPLLAHLKQVLRDIGSDENVE